jgi:hypothetical protein
MNLAPAAIALKERVLTGWTFQRFAFLALGGFLLTTAAMEHQWMAVLFGAYFASMGLFAFGCAGGACGSASFGRSNKLQADDVNPSTLEIEFEEIKST